MCSLATWLLLVWRACDGVHRSYRVGFRLQQSSVCQSVLLSGQFCLVFCRHLHHHITQRTIFFILYATSKFSSSSNASHLITVLLQTKHRRSCTDMHHIQAALLGSWRASFHRTSSSIVTPLPPKMSSALPKVRWTLPAESRATFSRSVMSGESEESHSAE